MRRTPKRSGWSPPPIDETDWDDEVRLMLEERASFSPDALTAMEANLRFAGPETMETRIFGRLTAWQNWVFQRPERGRRGGLAEALRQRRAAELRYGANVMIGPDGTAVDYDGLIPNNVGLNDDRACARRWRPGIPATSTGGSRWGRRVSRTAWCICAPPSASARKAGRSSATCGCRNIAGACCWRPTVEGRKIPFGAHKGEPAWQEVPGEYRAMLRRLLVIQGDTEPASVEQQRHLGATAPSLYDLRNLFQVNVEEGRHLWAMVYLLQKYFGRDGREEAEELLRRRSGDQDSPRMLGAFNEATPDWLSFFMFTFFTDRDGKMQLAALAQSGFDPLSRTCRFMLTEEAHHMFVGETGVQRIVQRTCEAMRDAGIDDPTDIERVRALGVIDLPTLQKKANLHFSLTLDLFGNEISTNAANAFNAGLKGRYREDKLTDDHVLTAATYPVLRLKDGAIVREDVPALSALNMRLRDDFVDDANAGVDALEPRAGAGRYRVPPAPAACRVQSPHRRVCRDPCRYRRQLAV